MTEIITKAKAHGRMTTANFMTGDSRRTKNSKPLYTSRIIKAGALLADTKTLLAHWDLDSSVQDNLKRIQHENIFGKASRSRVEDILRIFRHRYLTEERVTRALVILAQQRLMPSVFNPILFFHSAKSDRLLRDIVIDVLVPLKSKGITDIDVDDIQHAVTKWVKEKRTTSEWGEYTIRRVSQGLLATLRDFGVLEGAVNKRIEPAFLPISAFAYIVFYLKQHQASGAKLLELPDWKLFFLPREGVERFLFEAHQQGILEYHVAGSVTRLVFPAETLEEYANVLAQR